jgi:site-specific recombinase XerD
MANSKRAIGAGIALPVSSGAISASLDGSAGTNRGRGHCSLHARTDLDALAAWLGMFADSPSTQRSYAKEASRLWRWAVMERTLAFSSLAAEDLKAYFAFLTAPPSHWVSATRATRQSDDWRPLRGPLSASSLRQARTIVNALFTYLVDAGYLAGNPCALVRRRGASSAKRIERYIKRDEWNYLQSWLIAMPETSLAEQREKARLRHLCALLYLTAARLADVSRARMGDLSRREDGSWWWRVVGKGGKEAHVPATRELMESVRAYRVFFGLAPYPAPAESTPLLMRLQGPASGDKLLSDNMVYRIVKSMFEGAAQSARERGHDEIAAGLSRASTHWMRHTSLTHQVDAGVPLVAVRDNARHASIATTSRYLWADDKARHEETSSKLRMGPKD